MNKYFKYFTIKRAIFLVFVFLPFSARSQDTITSIVREITPSTVVVLTYSEQGQLLSQGSGFFINDRANIVTNWHVVQNAHHAEIRTVDGTVYPITHSLAEDQEGDLILLSADISSITNIHLQITASLPEVGERVLVVGSPLGLDHTVSDGIVSAVRHIDSFGNIIQITAPISPGSSGSPVVNMKGELLGIATFQAVDGQNLNFAIPSERILDLFSKQERPVSLRNRGNSLSEKSDHAYNQGLMFVWAGEYEQALPYFEQVITHDPRHSDAYFQIGYCKAKLDKNYEAIKALQQAATIDPANYYAYQGLGECYNRIRDESKAIYFLRQAISLKPDYAMAYHKLGIVYLNFGKVDKAIEPLRNAIAFDSDFLMAYVALGTAYTKLGKHDKSMECFKKAIRLQPDHALSHFGLGNACLAKGDELSALEEYKVLKELDPDLARNLFDLIYK